MFDPSRIADWLKLPGKPLFGVLVACALLLFLPRFATQKLGVDQLVATYQPWIGMVFILSLALCLVNALFAAGKFLKPWIKQGYWVRAGKSRLKDLTPQEKEILTRYISQDTRSQSLPIQNGVVAALESDGILVRTRNIGSPGTWSFAYAIQPWAWDYLRKRPELLR